MPDGPVPVTVDDVGPEGKVPPGAIEEPAASAPATAEQPASEPATPELTVPEAGEPASPEPVIAPPASAEPADSESVNAESVNAEPAVAQSALAESDSASDPADDAWSALERIRKDDGSVRGPVVEIVKGGLILDIGVRGFVPASQVEMRRVRDLRPYLGRELDAKIIEMDRNRGNVVLSRRAWLENNRPATRSELLGTLSPKQVRKGIVSSIAAFGVFVDLGGVDGLVHVSQLSWKHVDHPSEVVSLGQEVLVEVLEVDQERGRVSLSMRATQEDPWHAFARVRSIGQLVPGRVTKLVPFGAFVRLEDGVEGLVHISELTEERIERPEDVIRPGTEVVVKIVDLDVERRRIRLSLRQADDEYAEDESQFDPARYGMAATYDAAGAYIYPEGFDATTGDWLPGFEAQRDAWEADYARAYEVWQLHGRQVRDGIGPGVDAAPVSRPEPTPVATAEPAAELEPDSPQSVDEALAQLRERLSRGRED